MSGNKETTTQQQDEDTVVNYLTSQLKPFSINDLVLNLNNKFKKMPLLKILDELAKKDKIIITAFGKTSIYSAKDIPRTSNKPTTVDQDSMDQPNENPLKLAEQILQLREEQTEINNSLKQLNSYIISEQKNPSNQELYPAIVKLEEKLHHILQSLKRFNNAGDDTIINKDMIATIERSEKILKKEMKSRIRITKDILSVLTQNNKPNDLKELLENIGFEEVH